MAWTIHDHLHGKSDHVRAPYEAFERAIAACGAYDTTVTETAIAFTGPVRGFAGATPRSKSLTDFLDLMAEVHEAPFTRVTPYTLTLWVQPIRRRGTGAVRRQIRNACPGGVSVRPSHIGHVEHLREGVGVVRSRGQKRRVGILDELG